MGGDTSSLAAIERLDWVPEDLVSSDADQHCGGQHHDGGCPVQNRPRQPARQLGRPCRSRVTEVIWQLEHGMAGLFERCPEDLAARYQRGQVGAGPEDQEQPDEHEQQGQHELLEGVVALVCLVHSSTCTGSR